MTALDVITMNRTAYHRTCRRRCIYERVFGLLRYVIFFLAIVWCYTSRETLIQFIANSALNL